METYRTIIIVVIFLALFSGCFSTSNAQTLVPGIHGMSIVPDVKFTWVIISSDNEISVNLRYVGPSTSPPVTIIATALTNQSQAGTMGGTEGGSQVLNAGWTTPNSLTIKIDGASSLYDADLITVVASPYGSTSPPNPTLETTNNETTSPPPSATNEPTESQPQTFIPSEQPPEQSSSSSSNSDNEPKSSNKNNCDPSYPDFCIPPPPPDLNCADIGKKRFTVQGADPHGFDRDNDGVGCES